jgi:hypothetical protein
MSSRPGERHPGRAVSARACEEAPVSETRAPCGSAPPALLVMTVAGPVTLATVDALARLRLAARRVGLDVRLAADEPELRELLRLTGLEGVVACASVLEAGREPETLEQPGVEEVVEVGDPPA